MSEPSGMETATVTGGTYTLLIEVTESIRIDVGALGTCRFSAGNYAYTGSALGSGGFSRVERHRRVASGEHEVRHWHIDYLLGQPNVQLVDVIRSPGLDGECQVASALPDGPVSGFGATDCTCETHLASSDRCSDRTDRVREVHESLARSAQSRS